MIGSSVAVIINNMRQPGFNVVLFAFVLFFVLIAILFLFIGNYVFLYLKKKGIIK